MSEIQITEAPAQTRDDNFTVKMPPLSGARVGRAARRRQAAVQEMIRQMRFETRRGPDGRVEGPLRPCTAVNFNPVPLVVQGQLRITVPAPQWNAPPTKAIKHQMRLPFRGRLVQGHYVFIASPHIDYPSKPDQEPIAYTTVTGYERDSVLPIDVPTAEPRIFSPHAIGCELWAQYNSAHNKLMGGILLFDQDPHTLSTASLARTKGLIYVPERTQVGETWRYSYTLRETPLDEELDRIFEAQRGYADVLVQQAHQFWTEEDPAARKMITDTHREWARFALHMGYLEKLPEWVTARLHLSDDVREMATCPNCGKTQVNPAAYFCVCGAPYDTLRALRDGRAVPGVYVELLEGDEFEEAMTIIQARADRRQRMRAAGVEMAPESNAGTAGNKTGTAAKTATGGKAAGQAKPEAGK